MNVIYRHTIFMLSALSLTLAAPPTGLSQTPASTASSQAGRDEPAKPAATAPGSRGATFPMTAKQAVGVQQAIAQELGLPVELTITLRKDVQMDFVLIPHGLFFMGSSDGDKDSFPEERPRHKVRISKPFYLGKCEVSQDQWSAIMGFNWSRHRGRGDLPLEYIDWKHVCLFAARASRCSGMSLRLPTEAEWEYACRAGTDTPFSLEGPDSTLAEFAWYRDSASSKVETHPIGTKRPNAWGLHDMHGNVAEWCADWFGHHYYGSSPKEDPTGPDSPSLSDHCVIRGGSAQDRTRWCRSAGRSRKERYLGAEYLGFRLALDLPLTRSPTSAAAGPETVEASWPMTPERARTVQKDAAAALGLPVWDAIELPGGNRIKMVLVPAGTFEMGSPPSEPGREDDEGPLHRVRILFPFYMSACEITVEQYAIVANRRRPAATGLPVMGCSRHGATDFCRRLRERGEPARLPTEAEWEYACRAGSGRAYWFGDDPQALADHGWFDMNSELEAQPVGQKRPNPWGLYDMLGNASEWCIDEYSAVFYREIIPIDPVNPLGRHARFYVARGGSSVNPPVHCRAANRSKGTGAPETTGFRIVRPVFVESDILLGLE